jgi:hypothetical protein
MNCMSADKYATPQASTPLSRKKVMDVKSLGRYFTHSRSANQNHPLVCSLESSPNKRRMLKADVAIGQNIAPFRMGLQAPVPRRPELADHHKSPRPLVSDAFKEAIEHLVAESAEFVPAQLETPEGIFPYWLLHSLCSNDVLDHENSKISLTPSGSIMWIDALFLDFKKIAEIKKEERMLFQLKGSSVVWLWHEDVVRAVEKSGATGISFTLAQGYSQDQIFKS